MRQLHVIRMEGSTKNIKRTQYRLSYNFNHQINKMIKHRHRSQPTVEAITLETIQSFTTGKHNQSGIKLPKIKSNKLSQEQIDEIGLKVIQLKQICYGPIGCSKSIRLDKVLMLKKINKQPTLRPLAFQAKKKTTLRRREKQKDEGLEKSLRHNISAPLTAEYYISKIYM